MTSGLARGLTLLLSLLAVAPAFAPTAAVAAGKWTTPTVLYSTSTGYVTDPVLISDPSGDVHAIFPASAAAPGATGVASSGVLMYARLRDNRWSEPRDVLASNDGLAQPSIALDSSGWLNVIWRDSTGRLYYSRAQASKAGSATDWALPVILANGPVAPGTFGAPADVVATVSGTLCVVYAQTDGRLHMRQSDDGGASWSSPRVIVEPTGPGSLVDLPRLATNADSTMFLTWTELSAPIAWPPTGVFFSRSTDGGKSWSTPLRMAGPNYGLSEVATDGRRVYVVWNSTASVGQRASRESNDSGQTFGPINQVASPGFTGGFSGFPALIVDSAGVVHLVTTLDGSGAQQPSGIFATGWNGDHWSLPDYISMGAIGRTSVERPAAAVALGNRLQVLYEDDFHRIWYASCLLDAPTIQPVKFSDTPQPSSVIHGPTPTSTLPPSATDTAPATFTHDATAQEARDEEPLNGLNPIVTGLVPIIALLGLVLWFYCREPRR